MTTLKMITKTMGHHREYKSFPVEDILTIKKQMLNWTKRFSICCFLDSHNYTSSYHSVDCIAGAGALQTFTPSGDFFESVSSFTSTVNDYIFGHFNYDIKNKIEPELTSVHMDYTGFPEYYLFIPEVVLILKEDQLQIGVINESADTIYEQIMLQKINEKQNPATKVNPRISKAQYLEAINKLQKHIQLGDCYVINYCQEFYAYANIDPLVLYQNLEKLSPNPFAAFYKLNNLFLICASPERYIKKEALKLISQPIKGTASRNHADKVQDDLNKNHLFNSKKDRSENVMVVDLVRNDLSKVCGNGSVAVEELFGIYSFPHVHQMISTITGKLNANVLFGDILKATFPMGSMTGAPKRRVMELTEQYEFSKRGIYSGTVGYISPDKDFDFNVVIRSIVYNSVSQYLSYHVGGAITAYSRPEDEFEECLLKGRIISDLLSGKLN